MTWRPPTARWGQHALPTAGLRNSAAPVIPRAHFQHCPGLIAAALLCQYQGVVQETDCDLH